MFCNTNSNFIENQSGGNVTWLICIIYVDIYVGICCYMGHTATKPDKVNIGIIKNFRDQMKKLLITKNRVACNFYF